MKIEIELFGASRDFSDKNSLKLEVNENSTIKRKLKNHKFEQHSTVIKESDELKKLGLSKFVKKKFK